MTVLFNCFILSNIQFFRVSQIYSVLYKCSSVVGVKRFLLLYRISKQEHVARTSVVSCCRCGWLAVVYLMATMTLGAISVCMTVVVLNLHHKSVYRRLPPCLRRFLLVHLARLLRVDTTDRRAYVADQIWKRRVDYIVPLCDKSAFAPNGFQTTKDAAAAMTPDTSSSCFSCLSTCRWCNKQTVGGSDAATHKRSSSSKIQTRRRSSATKAGPAANTTTDDDDEGEVWKEVAQVVDRLFFWLILILMTMSTLSILLYPMYTGANKSMDR